MLKFINLKKLTAKTLIGVLIAGSTIIFTEGTREAIASPPTTSTSCEDRNNGHGDNLAALVTLPSGKKITVLKYDPTNPGRGGKDVALKTLLTNGNSGSSGGLSVIYEGEAESLSDSDAQYVLDNVPDLDPKCDYDNDGITNENDDNIYVPNVSLELILSVDVSGSVSREEFNTQVQGYISAFNDTDVQNAIKALPRGMAVSMNFWASRNNGVASIGWFKLKNDGSDGIEGLSDFLAAINAVSRSGNIVTINDIATNTGSGTDIKLAIDNAVFSVENNDYEGDRLVIDVSGDGIPDDTPYLEATKTFEYGYKNNQCGYTLDCPPVEDARDAAIAKGFTINGLPINNATAGTKDIYDGDVLIATVSKYGDQIDDYYRTQVVGGTKSFSLLADGFDDFNRAAQLKILNEILPDPTCISSGNCESPNTPPVANDDPDANPATAAKNNYIFASGQTKILNVVVENDTDADNDALSISQFNIDTNSGTLSIVNDNQLSYTAPSNIGTYTFMYEVYDGKGGVDKAEVEVDVRGYPD